MTDRPGKLAEAGAPAVHDLRALAEKAARRRPRRRPRISRAARLQLIDIVSRRASSGLAVIAGAVIFIAVSVGRAYPFRAAVWAAIVLAALFLCRRLQREFRAGARSASRPFRWRSNYTAALSVLGAAFGSGAVIAVPVGAPPELVFQSLALLMGATLVASVLHAAHGRSAAALFAPAGFFVFLGAIRDVGPATASMWAGAVATTGAAALLLFHRFLRERAIQRFPRTGFIRRSAARPEEEAADFAAAAARA